MRKDVGVIGLGVMGRNLARNLLNHGYSVVLFNRTAARTEAFLGNAADERAEGAFSLEGLVGRLARPRKILLMVKAGEATDAVFTGLLPLLDRGDVVIDGGNAHPDDTDRRSAAAAAAGVLLLGAGISGGSYGALRGPSIMVGGPAAGYRVVGPVLETIAARTAHGPCCALLGPRSAGHYVKTVHNGIEYAIMQILAEAYDLMKRGLGLQAEEIADRFGAWNRGDLRGYLVEITATILRRKDPGTGRPLIDEVVDEAAQKGTGKWSSQLALDVGTPAPTAAAAVFARIVSSLKAERVVAEGVLPGPPADRDPGLDPKDLRNAVLLGVVGAFAQGMRQICDASAERRYDLDFGEVARVWMDGSIIRFALLEPIREAFRRNPGLPYLLLAEPFRAIWTDHQGGLRRTAIYARERGLPIAGIASTLDAIDAYRSGRLPANLLQAQRDFFGAHGYRRRDRDGPIHTDWASEDDA